jgi:hypothetical protein
MLFGLLNLDREWMLTRDAQYRFLFASSVAMLWTVFFLCLGYNNEWIKAVNQSNAMKLVGEIVIVLGVFGALFIFFGMCWYCLRVDRSSYLIKTLWIILFISTGWLGSIIYYLFIYRPNVRASIVARGNAR